MYEKKSAVRINRKKLNRIGILFASFLMCVGIVVGTTIALLLDFTGGVVNTFTPAKVEGKVEEDFKDNIKQNVYVRNTSDVKVYVRATIVEYWQDAAGNIVPQPADCTCTIDWGSDSGTSFSSEWLKIGNIYYYTEPLEAKDSDAHVYGKVGKDETSNLIDKATVEIVGDYTYHLDVYTEVIQAEPTTAVTEAWGVELSGITITGPKATTQSE